MKTGGPEGWKLLKCEVCKKETWHMPMSWLPKNKKWKCGGCGEYRGDLPNNVVYMDKWKAKRDEEST